MRVAFIHPDLGLGGAERLVIDAALSLQANGHSCVIYTAFRDAKRCFADVSPSCECVPVRVLTVPFPRAILGHLHAILAALRCCALALYVCVIARPDVAVVDIVSLPVLVFAMFGVPVLFYCHFPDKTLEVSLRRAPSSRLRRMYRTLVDGAEELALGAASAVVCNSSFTQGVFSDVYPLLDKPKVVYPCVVPHDQCVDESDGNDNDADAEEDCLPFVSLNRFERKKNINLALEAFAHALKLTSTDSSPHVRLIIAGGYDTRVEENVSHFLELEHLAISLGIQGHVSLIQNVSESSRRALLRGALAVLYTPACEHFGIVPLEAMAAGTAVIAADSGGPTESVLNGVTGRLCKPLPEHFAHAMVEMIQDPREAKAMGVRGKDRAMKNFSREALGSHLEATLLSIIRP